LPSLTKGDSGMTVPTPPAPRITATPTPKVLGATGGSAVGTAVATLITWALDNYHLLSTQQLPAELQTSVTVIVTAVITFLVGYYVSPSPSQTTVQQDGKTYTATI